MMHQTNPYKNITKKSCYRTDTKILRSGKQSAEKIRGR
ncbi:hypothetical protein BRPE64_ACDS21010 [Caballeronia insecticola]|uniref:Uncharacterized protein n=1 Tax=Caballeronia insecticola TaxID=758793 RepID=R4WSD3_9BURK|nr:hypothetical protein BRPE64_ACDS21010 [Caballeronia insecticola]